LAALGFFVVRENKARMAVPSQISKDEVLQVFSKLALIEDEQWRAPQSALAQLLQPVTPGAH
jgi:hypothetical protein